MMQPICSISKAMGSRAAGSALALVLGLALGAGLAAESAAQETSSEEAEADLRSGSESASSGAADSRTLETSDPWAGVEQLIVTGSAAGDLLSDIANANSVTAFDSAELEAIGASDISDLAAFTPNLEIVTAGQTSPTLFIRGIGLNDFGANAAGSVAVFQDDIAINSPALQLGSLFDVETTNVLRGPQGSGVFRNASAGAIKVYSKKPTGEFGGRLKADYGNFDLVDVEGAVQFPIVGDTLAARMSFRIIQRDGLFNNLCAGAPPVSQRQEGESICGEFVDNFSRSDVDVDPASRLDTRNNWAARGVFRWRPELDWAEMDWVLILRGSRRDEFSTVGQSLGVVGRQTFPDTGTNPLAPDPQDDPPIDGILGGGAGLTATAFREFDVIAEERKLRSQLARDTFGCVLGVRPPDPRACSRDQSLFVTGVAGRKLAENLARRLDIRPFTGQFNHDGKTRNETFGVALTGDVSIGSLTLDWATGYDQWDRLVDTDLDFTASRLFETRSEDEGFQFYQSLTLSGDSPDALEDAMGGPIRWEVGGLFLFEDLDGSVFIDLGSFARIGGINNRTFSQKVSSLAGFATLEWDIWDDFTLDGGFRFNWERRQIDFSLSRASQAGPIGENQDELFTAPTGTIRLTYNASTEVSFYGKYTRGWKSGTFNATADENIGVTTADAEKIDAFEVGVRGNFFDDRVNFLGTFFHYSYENFQVFTSQTDPSAPPSFVILNAPDVELFGSEIETTVKPWEGGVFSAKFAWLEGEFLEFSRSQFVNRTDPNNPLQTIEAQADLDSTGNQLLNAPQFTISLSAQQTIPLGRYGSLTPRWDGVWKDDTFFDPTEGKGFPNRNFQEFLPDKTIGQEAFWLHNLLLTYRSPEGTIMVTGWVRNVTNQVYKVFSADVTTFQRTIINFVGEPRTYGLSVAYTF
jgi:iron complex outermembrane receptor protein